MLKKRIIFTLLYDNGYFIQSRNFRRQKLEQKSGLTKIITLVLYLTL